MRRFEFRRCVLCTALACGLWLGPAAALGQDVDAEYQKRFEALEADDLNGHYSLALWCREKEAYRLLRKQASYILRKKKDHEPAKLMLELAKRRLEAAEEGDDDANGPGGTPAQGSLGRILSDQEVQSLRRAELLLDRPDKVRVKFGNKVLNRFFAELEGSSGFDYGRRRFFKLPPSEKAQLILKHAPLAYGQDVEIVTDPQRFADYRRQVLPVVLDKCATSACHGAKGRGDWRIYNDKQLSTNRVYTDYLIMHEYSLGNDRLINRDFPEQSLLLTYGLPQGSKKHSVSIHAAFRDSSDRKYAAILDWINTLSVPGPDYGISISQTPGKP